MLLTAVSSTETELTADDIATSLTEIPGSRGISILDHPSEEGFVLEASATCGLIEQSNETLISRFSVANRT